LLGIRMVKGGKTRIQRVDLDLVVVLGVAGRKGQQGHAQQDGSDKPRQMETTFWIHL
jgi:hypothetical protein